MQNPGVQIGSLFPIPLIDSEQLHVAMQSRLYHHPFGAIRFGPLGPTPLRDSRYTFSLVRTFAREILSPLTIPAQNLETVRERIFLEPLQQIITAGADCLSVLGSIVAYVVAFDYFQRN